MTKKNNSKCLCCAEYFTADVRNRGRQKYCSKPACRAAAKAARQLRWRQKSDNQNYFRGPVHVERVRAWRAAHPGYWRAHRRRKRSALQDGHILQAIDRTSNSSEKLSVSAGCALQDGLQLQDPVLIGLIAQLTDSTLQDSIAATVRRLLELGQDILSSGTHDARQTGPTP